MKYTVYILLLYLVEYSIQGTVQYTISADNCVYDGPNSKFSGTWTNNGTVLKIWEHYCEFEYLSVPEIHFHGTELINYLNIYPILLL